MYKGKNPNRVTLYSDSNARGVDPTETEEDEIDEDDGQTDPEESERAESTISAGGAGVYPESMENIEDRHAGHSPENTELREFFEKQMTSGDRNIQIAIDRVYNGMSGQECALKYNCSVSAISKKEIKGLAALKQTLRAKGLTP
jgi:hypothetical protein